MASPIARQWRAEALPDDSRSGDLPEFLYPFFRLATRPTFTIKEGRSHARIGQLFICPHDPLMNQHRRGSDFVDRAQHNKIVSQARGHPVTDRDFDDGIGTTACAKLGELVDA